MSMNVKTKTTIGTVAAISAAAIALGAGTWASFSSTQTGPDTAVKAGTLDFGLSSSTDLPVGPFSPGDAAKSRTMTFTNNSTSSLPGTVSLSLKPAENKDNGCAGDESLAGDNDCGDVNGVGDLPDFLQVHVTVSVNGGPDTDLTGNAGNDHFVLLKDLPSSVSSTAVDPGNSAVFTIEFRLPNGTATNSDGVNLDNRVQGDTLKLLAKATLKQVS